MLYLYMCFIVYTGEMYIYVCVTLQGIALLSDLFCSSPCVCVCHGSGQVRPGACHPYDPGGSGVSACTPSPFGGRISWVAILSPRHCQPEAHCSLCFRVGDNGYPQIMTDLDGLVSIFLKWHIQASNCRLSKLHQLSWLLI